MTGYFNNAGGQAKVDGIAAFKGGTWTNVGSNTAGTDGPISLNTGMFALGVVGSKLYLGGTDSSIGDGAQNAYAASFRLRQPDGQVATGTSGGTFAGNNVYNATGASQSRSLTVHRNNTGTFRITVSNDGFTNDTFSLKGLGSSGGFTATYKSGATVVTAAVVAGTYSFSLAPGASKTVTLSVKVGSGVSVGTSHSWLETATSTGLGAAKDAVKATVKAS